MGAGGRRGPHWLLVVSASAAALAGVALLLLASAPAAADATLVPAGTMTSNEAWSSGGSPYQLVGRLVVPSGITLSIDAGTEVQYNSSAVIEVRGTLSITGSSSQNVILGPNGYTPCIEVNGTGSASIRYATFDRCSYGLVVNAGGSADVANSVFNYTAVDAVSVFGNSGGVSLSSISIRGGSHAILVSGGRARLSAASVTETGTTYGVSISSASDVTVRDSSFLTIQAAVLIGGASGVNITRTLVASGHTYALSANSADRLVFSNNSVRFSPNWTETVLLVGISNSTLAGNTLATVGWVPEEGVPPPPMTWAIQVRAPRGANTFSANTISNYDYGLVIDGAQSTQTITGNSFQGGRETGLLLRDTTGAFVSANRWTGTHFPLEVATTGLDLPKFYRHNVTITNTVDNRPILYLVDASGMSLDLSGGAGIVALVGAHNVSLTGGSLENGAPSLLIVDSADVTVSGTAIDSWWRAAEVIRSARVVLDNITAHGNLTCFGFREGASNRLVSSTATGCVHGILVEGSEQDLVADGLSATNHTSVVFFEGQNLTLRNSLVQDCGDFGVSDAMFPLPRESLIWPAVVAPLYGTPSGVTLENVSIGNCPTGVSLKAVTSGLVLRGLQVVQVIKGAELFDVQDLLVNGSSFSAHSQGLHVERATGGTVEGSTFAGTSGTGFSCHDCVNLTVRENLFVSNGAGIGIVGGSGMVFTRNEFYGNPAPASTNNNDSAWDDGAVGNLWDTYSGIDADGDGIGETPFVVSSGAWGTAQDNYPIAFRPDSVPPVANAGPDQTVDEDVRVYFTGYLSTDDLMVRVYLWTFVDGNQTVTLAGPTTWYVFENPGRYTVTLTVIDWGGNRDSDTLIVTVRDHTAPRVDAGGDRTVDEDVPVHLDAGRTVDNDPNFPAGAVYRWQVYDQQGVSTLLSPSVNWTFAIPGRYRVTLQVTDAAGNVGEDEIWITVRDTTPPTVPPLTTPVAEEDYPFSVYASLVTDNDPNWPIGKVEWFELWSHGSIIQRSNDSPGRFQVDTPGTYTAYYFVTDAAGNLGQANVTFRVKDVTPPDLTLYGQRSEEAGATLTFDLSLAVDNDPDFPAGATASWSIRLPSGAVVLDGTSVTYAFPIVGDFLVTLRVADADGNQAQTQFQVKVEDTHGPAVRIEGPATVEVGAPVSFRANASDPSGLGPVAWTVTGMQFPVSGDVLNTVFDHPGAFVLAVTVADTYGNGANATWTVVAQDTTAPTALVAVSPTPQGDSVRVKVNDTVSAAYIGSDAVGVDSVTWGWDDGSFGDGQTAEHAWSEPGEYVVEMHVRDAAGNVNTTSFRVVVDALSGGGGGGNGTGGGSEAPPVPTTEVLSPLSLALLLIGVGAGAVVGFFFARSFAARHGRR